MILTLRRGESDPPRRPEREGRDPTPGRWSLVILVAITGSVALARLWGTAGVVLVWLGLLAIVATFHWLRKRR